MATDARTPSIPAGTEQRLPTLRELICSSPFLEGDLRTDAAAFARQLQADVLRDIADPGELADAVSSLLEAPGIREFSRAAAVCRTAADAGSSRDADLWEAAARLDYYAASCGCPMAARRVGAEAVAIAEWHASSNDEVLDLAVAALGWMAVDLGVLSPYDRQQARTRAAEAAERVFDRVAAGWRARISQQEPAPMPWEAEAATGDAEEVPPFPPGKAAGLMVVHRIGNARTTAGKQVAAAFADVSGVELPLLPVPDLDTTRRCLVAAFPHAAEVVDAILAQLEGRPHLRLRPLILLGPPGCGKTTFARALLDALGVPHEVYPCGSAADTSLSGNPRRWQTGEPSLPLSLAAAHRVASPGVVLDEIEKAATGHMNGNFHDGLLGLLEPRSSASWLDPYVEAPVDLSGVIWVGTANTMDGIPAALRDRCQVVRFPEPRRCHLAQLGAALLVAACEDRGIDPRWATPLDGVELGALAANWRGGSLRTLSRLVEGVLAARNRAPCLN